MGDVTDLEATNVIWRYLMGPTKTLVENLIRRFFDSGEATPYVVQLGTITSDYVSGKPKVIFDRDDSASGKTYAYAARYTPVANDRVIMVRCGHSWVVWDKLIS